MKTLKNKATQRKFAGVESVKKLQSAPHLLYSSVFQNTETQKSPLFQIRIQIKRQIKVAEYCNALLVKVNFPNTDRGHMFFTLHVLRQFRIQMCVDERLILYCVGK